MTCYLFTYSKLDTHKSMGSDGMHLRKLVKELIKLLETICQQSWLTGEGQVDGKLANVHPQKCQKDDSGSYRLVSLSSVLGKVIEQILLSAITCYVQDS